MRAKRIKGKLDKLDSCTTKELEGMLDDIFSVFVRTRNLIDDEFQACYTCGRVARWQDMDCGHFIGRQDKATRWSEMNTRPQCKNCNKWREGQKARFRELLVREYGEPKVGLLEFQGHSSYKPDRFILAERIKEYWEIAGGFVK